MIRSKLLVTAVAAAALGVAGPAFAQTSAGGSTVTGAGGNNSDTSVTTVSKSLTFSPSLTLSPSKTSTNTSTKTSTRTSTETNTDNSQRNGNIKLVADQSLDASISNKAAFNMNGASGDYATGGGR